MNILKPLIIRNILLLCFIGISASAYAVSPDVKEDLLIAKIITSLKAGNSTDALPYFIELESTESSLAKPLPESFHYYFIEALSKSGDKDKTLKRADIYLTQFGKGSKYYDKVIEIISPIQIERDKETARHNVKMGEYNIAYAKYLKDKAQYDIDLPVAQEKEEKCAREVSDGLGQCQDRATAKYGGFFGDAVKEDRQRRHCVKNYDSDKCFGRWTSSLLVPVMPKWPQ